MKVRILDTPFKEAEPLRGIEKLTFLKTQKVQVKFKDGSECTIEEKNIIDIRSEEK